MRLSLNKYLPLLALAALTLGVMLGAMLGAADTLSPLAQAAEQACELAACLTVASLHALAIPLVFSSIVLGGVGLETMRTMGKVVGKTLGWMVGTSALAVAIACGVKWCVGPTPSIALLRFLPVSFGHSAPKAGTWTWGWVGLVLVSLGFSYYRNQLEEGHGKLVVRFCQGLEGMVNPLLRWAKKCSPVAIFLLAIITTARHTSYSQTHTHEELGTAAFWQRHGLLILAAGTVYLVVLSLVVWVKTRIGPWRYAPAVIPAMLVAASGQSVEAALPLTMETLRRRIGVSNRVVSAVLPLGAALHRDGVALLWATAMIALSDSGGTPQDWSRLIATGIMAFTLGCGSNALAGQGGFVGALFVSMDGWEGTALFPFVLGWIVVSFGNAISVFSQVCATIIISRSEGEFWVPGLPPAPDELQGLKTDLELVDS